MKNILKSILFIIIFIIIFYSLSYLFLPKSNMKKFSLYKISSYEILGENPDSVDVVMLGDSLVYSSIVPMEIYGNYGYTVFDCSEPAMLLSNIYNYYNEAIKSQKPKIAFVEANSLFRDPKKKKKKDIYIKSIKNTIPLFRYHNNWKKMLFSNTKLINLDKGYRLNKTSLPSKNRNYMIKNKINYTIPQENMKNLEKIIKISKENNIKLVIIGFPSQKSWNYSKDQKIKEVSKKYNLEYINLNKENNLKIDWSKDTKDNGDHLNYYGALKTSKYIGEYLKNTKLLKDHRNDPKYSNWNKAYKKYQSAN